MINYFYNVQNFGSILHVAIFVFRIYISILGHLNSQFIQNQINNYYKKNRKCLSVWTVYQSIWVLNFIIYINHYFKPVDEIYAELECLTNLRTKYELLCQTLDSWKLGVDQVGIFVRKKPKLLFYDFRITPNWTFWTKLPKCLTDDTDLWLRNWHAKIAKVSE